jgi:thiamine kinase-like enzyme
VHRVSSPITIDEVIEKVPEWKGKSLSVSPLSGGLTNINYRVDVDGMSFVVRIPGANTELLAVDRSNEYHNTLAAAETGVCPRIVHYLPDTNVLVRDFIRAETMSKDKLQRTGMPTRMAQAIKQLHSGPRFMHDFNMFRLTEHYLRIVQEHDVRIPTGYRDYLPQVARIEAALARNPLPSVPCHNDLLGENYLDDGQSLWLIDFEYSGNNDPTFELGNTCQEQQFDEPRMAEMCTAYFGGDYPDMLARMRLNMIMSDVGWTLWGVIQANISTIPFDFWSWGIEKWDRAKETMASDELDAWLRAV